MNEFPPNLDPKIYNLSAVIIGFTLIGNFTSLEQNAIGNWFITLGQILENNSAWQQVMENRTNNVNYFQLFDLNKISKSLNIIIDELKKMQ